MDRKLKNADEIVEEGEILSQTSDNNKNLSKRDKSLDKSHKKHNRRDSSNSRSSSKQRHKHQKSRRDYSDEEKARRKLKKDSKRGKSRSHSKRNKDKKSKKDHKDRRDEDYDKRDIKRDRKSHRSRSRSHAKNKRSRSKERRSQHSKDRKDDKLQKFNKGCAFNKIHNLINYSSRTENTEKNNGNYSYKTDSKSKTNEKQSKIGDHQFVESDEDDDFMIDEEEILRKEMEERQKRFEELKKKHENALKQNPNEMEAEVKSNIEGIKVSVIDQQVVTENIQQEDSKFDQINQDQIESQVKDLDNTNQEILIEEVKQIHPTNVFQYVLQNIQLKQIDQKQFNEFYRMLDHQRKDWYEHQVEDQEPSNPISQQDNQDQKQAKKKLNMFDESSDEDEHLQEVIKEQTFILSQKFRGFKVTTGQVDTEGYYIPKVGEIIRNRYKVTGIAGKGVFSRVVKAVDMQPQRKEHEMVAIKIIRMFDIMRQSGEKEREIVAILNKADPHDKKHIIRLLETFEYNNHLCLVYECMELNLRETMHKYGRNVGLSLDGVCLFGRQLFLALDLLHKQKLIHADLKPDNIMVDKDAKKIKLCDFGSCISNDEAAITEYMVSRFYRAPEIMLGCEFDQAIDIWSAGVTLYELYTGKVMFYGRSNNEMLKLIMASKGKIKTKLLKKGSFVERHFSLQNLNVFLSQEEDPINKGQFYVKPVPMPNQPSKPIIQMLKNSHKLTGGNEEQANMLHLADFLEKALVIDPKKRMTAEEALIHPFLNILQERMKQSQNPDRNRY